jgi:hypothetical protein
MTPSELDLTRIKQYNSVLSTKQIKELKTEHEEQFFPSRFDFLNSHLGIRPGKCHFLLGGTGCGKSSLLRAIILDTAKNVRVMCHLSEEHEKDYKYKMHKQLNDKGILENIYVFTENQRECFFKSSFSTFFSWLESNISLVQPQVVFFDNLTTSYLWTSLDLKAQEEALMRFNNIAEDLGVAFFFVLHTKKDVTDSTVRSLIQPEDCRGTQQSALIAPYFYVFQNFKNETGNNATVRVAKARFHDNSVNKFYSLTYNRERGTYIGDCEISFKHMMLLYQDRYRFNEKKGEKSE